MEWSPTEVADIGEVAAWAAQQPWSNGPRRHVLELPTMAMRPSLQRPANQPAIRAVYAAPTIILMFLVLQFRPAG